MARALLGIVRVLLSVFFTIAALMFYYSGEIDKATYMLVWAVFMGIR